MPKISFSKREKAPIEVPVGVNLMKGLLEAGTAVASSCGGEGVCAKCVVRVNKGQENLSKPQELENDLSEIHGFMKIERVSCQVSVLGDIEIDTDYW